jgi:hypothetical protein
MKRVKLGTVPITLFFTLLAGCVPKQGQRADQPPAPPARHDLQVVVFEVVENAEQEGSAYAKVFVDGQPAGETPQGPRSQQKAWSGPANPGNHLIKVEYWTLQGPENWVRLDDDRQPRERFVRVEPGARSRVTVKFFDRARQNALSVSKEPK